MKSRFVKVEEMDFVTGLDEVIAETYDEPPPKNIWEKFWLWIVSTPAPSIWSWLFCSFVFTVLDGHEFRSFNDNPRLYLHVFPPTYTEELLQYMYQPLI